MRTICKQLDNYQEIREARAHGYDEPEEVTSWTDFWVDMSKIVAAKTTRTGDDEKAISLWLNGAELFLVPDTQAVRRQLDERFGFE